MPSSPFLSRSNIFCFSTQGQGYSDQIELHHDDWNNNGRGGGPCMKEEKECSIHICWCFWEEHVYRISRLQILYQTMFVTTTPPSSRISLSTKLHKKAHTTPSIPLKCRSVLGRMAINTYHSTREPVVRAIGNAILVSWLGVRRLAIHLNER